MLLYLCENNINLEAIDTQISYVKLMLKAKNELRKQLVSYMDKITTAVNNIINPVDISFIHKCLEDLKSNFEKLDSNILSLKSLITLLNSFKEDINNVDIEKYNSKCNIISNDYLNINIAVYEYIDSFMPYISFRFPEIQSSNNNDIISESKTDESQDKDYKKDSCTNLQENTLIISEKTGKVTLPFTIFEIKDILKKDSSNFNSIQDVIDKNYTIPLEVYKNAPLARFKEAFKLIKYKEKGSLKNAFDLGFELFFNYNLNPAIITACKNLDELDIYLSYLEDAKISDFKCFNIVYEYSPLVITKPK